MVCLEPYSERSWSKLPETGPNSKMTKSLVVEVVRVTTDLFFDTGVKKMKWFLSSHEVPFTATSDWRSRVAGNGTEREVKTIELS